MEHTDPTTGAKLVVDSRNHRAAAVIGEHITYYDCATLDDFVRLFKAVHESAKQLGLKKEW